MTLSVYLRKRAGFDDTVQTAMGVTKDVFMAAMATAALAGVGTGFMASRLTSPRPTDLESDRKRFLLEDMRTRLAKYKLARKRDAETAAEPSAAAREIRL